METLPGLATSLMPYMLWIRIAFDFREDMTPKTVECLTASVTTAHERLIRNTLNESPKTWMLKDRVEYTGRGRTDKSPLMLRHYLRLTTIPSHRIAFTRILLSCHTLAVERLRWATRARPQSVPRDERLCRLCVEEGIMAVEDEVHALLRCTSNARLVELREKMWDDPEMRSSG